MSLDLSLLPYNIPDIDPLYFSHVVLPLETNSRNLMEDIEEASRADYPNSIDFIKDEMKATGDVEETFTSYLASDEDGETTYGRGFEDAYGDRMRWIRVSELLKFANHPQVKKYTKNKAAWGYLATCPPEQRVALFWR